MNRSLCLSTLLVMGQVWLPAQASPEREALVMLGSSVLRVEAPQANGGYSLGSAVVVGPQTAVTNCHVTRNAVEIFVIHRGVRSTASAQADDLQHDLCMLRVPDLESPAVPMGTTSGLSVGQPVTAIGFTGGIGIQSSEGHVVGLHRYDNGRVIQSTNWFSSGASGGGLFDDKGYLVGILTFRLRGGEAHYFAAPVEWIQRMVAGREPAAFKPVAPLVGNAVPYWQTAPALQPPFLRAAYLEQINRWGELESMANDWSRNDPDNAQPWFWLGAALERRDRLDEARRAFACSLSLDPSYEAARVRMAALALRAGAGEPVAAPSTTTCPTVTGRP